MGCFGAVFENVHNGDLEVVFENAQMNFYINGLSLFSFAFASTKVLRVRSLI